MNYFKDLHSLVPETSETNADVIFDCKDTLDGQKLLSTAVKGHSVILSKRCPWLAEKIRASREHHLPPTTIPFDANVNTIAVASPMHVSDSSAVNIIGADGSDESDDNDDNGMQVSFC